MGFFIYSFNECLSFFSFSEEEWISLYTSNIIERLNKEFKRRKSFMEVVAGEVAVSWLEDGIAICGQTL